MVAATRNYTNSILIHSRIDFFSIANRNVSPLNLTVSNANSDRDSRNGSVAIVSMIHNVQL